MYFHNDSGLPCIWGVSFPSAGTACEMSCCSGCLFHELSGVCLSTSSCCSDIKPKSSEPDRWATLFNIRGARLSRFQVDWMRCVVCYSCVTCTAEDMQNICGWNESTWSIYVNSDLMLFESSEIFKWWWLEWKVCPLIPWLQKVWFRADFKSDVYFLWCLI